MFHFPTGETKGNDNWRIHGVMMTDDPEKFRDRKYKRRIYNANQIAKALAIWMRYPGRSMLDWKAYDAGAPQEVIDRHERKGSASPQQPR